MVTNITMSPTLLSQQHGNPFESTCRNTKGSYECDCNIGYIGADDNVCIDIDECANNDHFCHSFADCRNTDGSYSCKCELGYEGSGLVCLDVDECRRSDLSKCHDEYGICTNNVGSYECDCISGYTGDGIFCDDIDECFNGIDECSDVGICHNTPGRIVKRIAKNCDFAICHCKNHKFATNTIQLSDCFLQSQHKLCYITCKITKNCD